MGGGPNNITSSQSPGAWALPWAERMLGMGGGLATRNLQTGYPGSLNYQVAGLTPDQQSAFGMTEAASGPASGIANMGAGNLDMTLKGDFLSPNSNPWLAQTAQAADQSTVNAYNMSTAPSLMAEGERASGGGPGSLAGSSSFLQQQASNQYDLSRSLGDTNANIYSGNYQAERQRQIQATGLIPQTQQSLYAPANALMGTGTFQQNQQQNVLNANQQNASQAQNYPWQNLNQFANLYSALTGGSSLGTSTNPLSTK